MHRNLPFGFNCPVCVIYESTTFHGVKAILELTNETAAAVTSCGVATLGDSPAHGRVSLYSGNNDQDPSDFVKRALYRLNLRSECV